MRRMVEAVPSVTDLYCSPTGRVRPAGERVAYVADFCSRHGCLYSRTDFAPDGRLFLLDDFDRAFRQCAHEGASVRLGNDAIVKNDNDSLIRFRANQSSDALSQF